jgi:hypothetical protein
MKSLYLTYTKVNKPRDFISYKNFSALHSSGGGLVASSPDGGLRTHTGGAEGLACADPGARNPIDASRICILVVFLMPLLKSQKCLL